MSDIFKFPDGTEGPARSFRDANGTLHPRAACGPAWTPEERASVSLFKINAEEVPNGYSPGEPSDVVEANEITRTFPNKTFLPDVVVEQKKAEIDAVYLNKLDLGYRHTDGHLYAADDEEREHLKELSALAGANGGSLPMTVPYLTSEGEVVNLAAAAFTNVVNGVAGWKQGLFMAARQKAGEVDAIAAGIQAEPPTHTADDLLDYDTAAE